MKSVVLTLLVLLLPSSVFAQVELCRNTQWTDEDGCGCDEYDFNPEWCEEFGEFEWEGSSANEACCACGGGRAIFIEGSETDAPIVIGEKNCIFSPPVEVAPGLTVENWVDNDNLEFRMRLTYEGKSWIGVSFENDGRPGKPSFAVIGRMLSDGASSVRKYILNTANPDASGVVRMPQGSQTLEDVSFVQTTSKTIMTFTKPINEIFDIPEQIVTDRTTWIYAVGLPNNAWQGSHTIHGTFNMALNSCFTHPWEINNPSVNGGLVDGNALDRRSFFGEKPNKIMWIAHGISLAVAWGIVAPLALAASFLRKKRASWAKWSQVWNTTLLLLTCAGILLGVIATYLDDRSAHLRSEHSYWGVGVFGGLLLYCMMALYFGAVRAQEEKRLQDELARQRNKRVITRVVPDNKTKEPDVILGMGDGLEVVPGDSPHNPKNKNKKKQSLYSDPVAPPSMADPEPTVQRKPETTGCMEWFSRLLLLACIAVAYYACHSGLEWQVFHYELEWDYYYWGVGAVGVLIILLLVPLSCCLKENISTSPAPAASRQAPSGDREAPSANGADGGNGNGQMMFAKGVDEDSYYPDSSTYDDETTMRTTGQLIDEEKELEEKEAQRSPMRASWSMDTCCL